LKHTILIFFLSAFSITVFGQPVETSFNLTFEKFLNSPELKHATVSLLLRDLKTGKIITDVNSQTGLAPASTQKVVTATTAYSLLGKDFRYQTKIGYTGKIENGKLTGDIIIRGSGDPTLGSWRYGSAKEDKVINDILNAVSQYGIHEITGHVLVDESEFSDEVIPDGWIWQDIGNYYGAGARALNWRENQFDLYLKSGSVVGTPVQIAGTRPEDIYRLRLRSFVTAGPAGSGDNGYIYLPMFEDTGNVRGTVPVNQDRFSISGTMPHPARQLAITIESRLKKKTFNEVAGNYPFSISPESSGINYFYSINSPALDSICYWFLQKSINLYGEALLKTLGKHFGKNGSTSEGVKVVQDFWKKQGMDDYALNIIDGSGLSPQNRITTDDLVRVMSYAKQQSWFPSFYDDLPVFNGIKMKSGSINGVLSYTGFIKNNSGDYVFAFIVNNYNGSGSAMRKKMWKVLDVLKP